LKFRDLLKKQSSRHSSLIFRLSSSSRALCIAGMRPHCNHI